MHLKDRTLYSYKDAGNQGRYTDTLARLQEHHPHAPNHTCEPRDASLNALVELVRAGVTRTKRHQVTFQLYLIEQLTKTRFHIKVETICDMISIFLIVRNLNEDFLAIEMCAIDI